MESFDIPGDPKNDPSKGHSTIWRIGGNMKSYKEVRNKKKYVKGYETI